jgi:predicted nucleic acid-binding protein
VRDAICGTSPIQYLDQIGYLDERLGRLHAEAMKLTFTGTLGILLRAKVEGRIPRIEPLLGHLGRLGASYVGAA